MSLKHTQQRLMNSYEGIVQKWMIDDCFNDMGMYGKVDIKN